MIDHRIGGVRLSNQKIVALKIYDSRHTECFAQDRQGKTKFRLQGLFAKEIRLIPTSTVLFGVKLQVYRYQLLIIKKKEIIY
jgi:hypothetical protein